AEDISHFQSLIFMAGLSGAGKSTANRAFSDEGYYSIDNLPIALLPNILALSRRNPQRFQKTSILLDVASAEQRESLFRFLEELPYESPNWRLVFLDAPVEKLLQRYSETRRPHPSFEPEDNKTLAEAIQNERSFLQPVRERANIVIETGSLTPHDLRREIRKTIYSFGEEEGRQLRINFQSFGFKYGAPTDCDLIVDVRFLPNPHFIDELRPKTGEDKEVSNYVLQSKEAEEFLARYSELLTFLLPHYSHEGKAYLNVGVGCTGGRHRSVAISRELSRRIKSGTYVVSVSHRDIEKANAK
ncbi:RNase adapter RapZ, partial [bacterium]|nr:RNase adapter RapZ [bacterium]